MRRKKEVYQELINLLAIKAYTPPETLLFNGLILETKINVLKWVLNSDDKNNTRPKPQISETKPSSNGES